MRTKTIQLHKYIKRSGWKRETCNESVIKIFAIIRNILHKQWQQRALAIFQNQNEIHKISATNISVDESLLKANGKDREGDMIPKGAFAIAEEVSLAIKSSMKLYCLRELTLIMGMHHIQINLYLARTKWLISITNMTQKKIMSDLVNGTHILCINDNVCKYNL